MTLEKLKKATLIAIKRPRYLPQQMYASDEFSFTIQLNGDADTPLLYQDMYASPIGVSVNWGDGTRETTTSEEPMHQYAAPGTYTIIVKGAEDVFTNKTGSINKSLISINCRYPEDSPSVQWFRVTTNCVNLLTVPSDLYAACRWIWVEDLFSGDEKMVSIPTGFFRGYTETTRYKKVFEGCRRITKIPPDLFEDSPLVETFENCFKDCSSLKKIPNGLFANCINATDFRSCFLGCSGLIEIAQDVFPEQNNHCRFDSCFSGCTGLTSIPEELFAGIPDLDLWYTFQNCSSLGSLPSALLTGKTHVYLYGAFLGCTGITAIPEGFIPQTGVTNLQFCFAYCTGITGNVPRLWETHQDVPHYRCFYQCTNAANYADIPADWK